MKNYIVSGEFLPVTLTAAVASGQGALNGALFGVATRAGAIGDTVDFATSGVYELPKVTGEAWTVGAKLYWKADNSGVTTTATGNTLIGVAYAAAAAAANAGLVRLSGVPA